VTLEEIEAELNDQRATITQLREELNDRQTKWRQLGILSLTLAVIDIVFFAVYAGIDLWVRWPNASPFVSGGGFTMLMTVVALSILARALLGGSLLRGTKA
jgi:hypothetical protein